MEHLALAGASLELQQKPQKAEGGADTGKRSNGPNNGNQRQGVIM